MTGAQLALVFEPRPAPSPPRATLFFQPRPPAMGLNVVVEGVRPDEGVWPFAFAPIVRTGFRFAGVVRSVRFATVRSFAGDGASAVRVEVDLEGEASLALEGTSVAIGPVTPAPPPPRAPDTVYS